MPIYNVELYVGKTISSICEQTYKNVEIILVDDGSTDDSGSICERYAEKDNRIKVIHKNNGGLVSARRMGVMTARGTYSMMVDGDDWIETTMVENLYKMALEHHVRIVSSGLYRDYNNDLEEYTDALEEGVYRKSRYNDVKDKIIFWGCETVYGIRPSVVAKLYNTQLLRDIYKNMSDEIENGEDWAVVYPLIFNTKEFYVSNKVFYHYVIRDDSITHSANSQYLLSMQKWYEHMLNNINDINDSVIKKQVDLGLVKLVLRGINYHMDLHKEVTIPSYVLPNDLPTGRYVLYGAGKVGTAYYSQLVNDEKRELVAWIDQKWSNHPDETKHVEFIKKCEFDYILIAITYEGIAESIKRKIMQAYGIDKDKIIWREPKGIMDTYVRWGNAE